MPEDGLPMNYVEPPDVPEGLTLREYRRRPKAVARPRRHRRIRRRLLRLFGAR